MIEQVRMAGELSYLITREMEVVVAVDAVEDVVDLVILTRSAMNAVSQATLPVNATRVEVEVEVEGEEEGEVGAGVAVHPLDTARVQVMAGGNFTILYFFRL